MCVLAHFAQHRQRVAHWLVDVFPRVGLAGGHEDGDLTEPGFDRALETPQVRDQGGVAESLAAAGTLGDLGVVRELGNPSRRDETRQLDMSEAGVGKGFGELDLVLCGHEGRFVLQTVAQTDFVDLD